MARSRIDRDKVRVFLRTLTREDLLNILDEAVGLVPAGRLCELFEDLSCPDFSTEDGRRGRLLAAVKKFRDASLAGEYYEDFAVNSKNFMDMSRGTETWIAECERLLTQCVAASEKDRHGEAREAFDILFDLLRHIDEGHDDVVFFADEGGSRQVGVEWREVLPAWFTCLADTTDADEYAENALKPVQWFAKHDTAWFLRKAKAAAKPAQKKALLKLQEKR